MLTIDGITGAVATDQADPRAHRHGFIAATSGTQPVFHVN